MCRWLSLVISVLVAVGCAPATRSPTPASTQPSRASRGSSLVLFSDGALLRYSEPVTFDKAGLATLVNAPAGVRTRARLEGGRALSSERALPATDASMALRSTDVVVTSQGRRIQGRLVSWDERGLTLKTAGGLALVSTPVDAVEVAAPPSALSGELLLRGGDAGEHLVDFSTWLSGIRWRVAYTIILAGLEAESASLQGWLAIDSGIGQPFSVEQVAIVDGRSSKLAEDNWVAYRRRAENKPEVPQQPRAPVTVLDRGIEVEAGGSIRLPLFGKARPTAVRLSRVFDPVGAKKNHEGSTPISRRNYGLAKENEAVPVSLSVQLDLTPGELARLPAGDISLFARTGGAVRPLGVTRGFGPSSSAVRDLISDEPSKGGSAGVGVGAPKARPGEIRIGVAAGLTGRRWQEEFHFDPVRKRIVEELRVELKNDAEDDARVVVHEHLYRGLNWSLAYHNGVGEPSKEAAQEVRFRVTVPGKGKVLVMYRVVYTW